MIKEANAVQMLEFLHIMEVSLRSGYNVSQSMEIFIKDANSSIVSEVQKTVNDLHAGASLPDAYDQWLNRQPSRELDLIVAAIHTQIEAGGNLANKFQFISQMIPHLQHVV